MDDRATGTKIIEPRAEFSAGTMSEDHPLQQDSMSSRTSTTSRDDVTPPGSVRNNPNINLNSVPRNLSGPRQSAVSMFTGRTDAATSPGLAKRDHPFSALSPGSIDRVFPVRSAVSIDPYATPLPRNDSTDSYPGLTLKMDGLVAARRDASRKSPQAIPESPLESDAPGYSRYARRKSMASSAQTPSEADVDFRPLEGGRRYSGSETASAARVDNLVLQNLISDSTSMRSNPPSEKSGGLSAAGARPESIAAEQEPSLVTARFKHVVTDGGHMVITGRDGETLQRCEDEPIHIPGAIQSFGLLLAFRELEGKLSIRVASENSAAIIGYAPAQLFKLDNFLDIFTEEQADNLLDHLDFIRDDDNSDVVANGPEVFMMSIRPPHHRTRKLWCAMHACESDRELIICEFEVEDDLVNPLVPNGEATPEPPEDTLDSQPTEEEFAESTINISKPLKVLRSARKKRSEAAAMEVFNIMSQVQEQLANAPSLQVFLRVLIGVVKELTGFHRVMVYQFDHSWNGRVVAELVDPRATKDLYKGLNFPASDIPKQAREMYKVNKVRLLYDRDLETSRLVCRTLEDLETPLDMTHAYLRAMSPIHLKYLSHMAVRSSMSISINAFNELWGLIACHTYGSKGMRVSFPIRKMCRLVGDTASRNIERLSYAARLQARKLINTTSSPSNPSGYIVASSEDLLKLFDADVGALSIRDETKILGNPRGHLQEVLAMVEYLRMRKLNTVVTSQDINLDFPDLRYAPGLKFIAGLLYVPLSNGGSDFIIFFRRGVMQEVKWAGNPYEKYVKEGTEGYLEPRKSFKMWSEMIVGRCRDWSEEETETASVLCLVYGKFIDVWRQKEAALQNSQLTRLLLANSAHEVRTPLNAIINYLEIALEGSLDHETRENLARSHSASKSLVYVINDLLDLTKTEGGRELITEEQFELPNALQEATDAFVGDAKRKKLEYTVQIAPDLPQKVIGDYRRVRQVVSNLIANAVQHTVAGHVSVEATRVHGRLPTQRVEIEVTVEDTGAGMSQSKVDALFRELEEVSYETDIIGDKRLLSQEAFSETQSSSGAILGLGLAVVARTVRNMNGQLRLKTEEGKGSRFIIVLGFDTETSINANRSGAQGTLSSPESNHETVPPDSPSAHSGEVTLVGHSTPKRHESGVLMRKESTDSVKSIASIKSGKSSLSLQSGVSQKSDADRLIDAISEPLRITEDAVSLRQQTRSKAIGHRKQDHGFIENKSLTPASSRESRLASTKVPGQENVMDSGIPIKAIRMPDEGLEHSAEAPKRPARVTFEDIVGDTPRSAVKIENLDEPGGYTILVAEDDPINSKIMKKRLEKMGHTVYTTVNGEECSTVHGDKAASFDAVLMDLQMPIVDGFTSTKMIRSFEKTQADACLSARAKINGRVPIFAVSASLVEKEREKYIQTGFDGWILKPVDFKRVALMLKGVVDDGLHNECVYEPGLWERGGWFEKRDSSTTNIYSANTEPNQKGPTQDSKETIRKAAAEPTTMAVVDSSTSEKPAGTNHDQ